MRCVEADMAYYYLSEDANRFQRDFLKTMHEDNPEGQYLHFGDIDAGGLYTTDNAERRKSYTTWNVS